jgi:hypothetical protein
MVDDIQNNLSFPNAGGTAVSSDTLSASLHSDAYRRTGSEKVFLSWRR